MLWNSFFGDQEGDFSLNIKSIKAVSPPADLEKGSIGVKNEGVLKSKRGEVQKSETAVGTNTRVRL
jgi:hypothetical protein